MRSSYENLGRFTNIWKGDALLFRHGLEALKAARQHSSPGGTIQLVRYLLSPGVIFHLCDIPRQPADVPPLTLFNAQARN